MATFGTFVDGTTLKASELNDLFKKTSFVPVLRQSNTVSTETNRRGLYFSVNKVVVADVYVSATTGGTPNNAMEIDLPVTAASSSIRVIGHGHFRDSSASDFILVRAVQVSTTRMAFITETSDSLTAYLGTTNGPAITLASGDILTITIQYEAA